MSRLVRPLLDSGRVARLIGVEVATLGTWRRKGYGPRWYRIGKKIKYAESDLHSWMNGQVNAGVSARDPRFEVTREELQVLSRDSGLAR